MFFFTPFPWLAYFFGERQSYAFLSCSAVPLSDERTLIAAICIQIIHQSISFKTECLFGIYIYAGLNDISIHSLRHRMKHHAEKGMLSCVWLLTSPFIFQAVTLRLYFQGSIHQGSRNRLRVLLKARAIRHASCLWPFSWCLVSLGQIYGDNTVEKVGIGKFEVTFSNEFASHALTLELHPFFTILCVPPLGLGSLPNQCWY